jgi:predicted Ser/Thr protein kinase
MSSDPTSDALAATAAATVDTVEAGADISTAVSPAVERIGRYQIERQLGAGGMGIVYAAFDPELERRVALKVLKATSDDARARLLREARALAKLAHPNVVAVHEVGSIENTDFVAMELVDGQSLDEWFAAEARSPEEILAVFRAAGNGLAAAHAVGLVHRDFKPHNVLRSREGRVMVVDFGLARTSADAVPPAASSGNANLELTVVGSWIGTPAYMAPEQWDSAPITPAVDQFAFCVALWEALAGTRPFTGKTLDELRAAVAAGVPDGGDDKIPRALRPLLRRGLERDPAKRWPSMDMLLAALAPPPARRPSNIRLAVVGIVVVAAALAIGALVSRRDRGRDRRSSATAVSAPTAGITKFADGAIRVTPAAMTRIVDALRTPSGPRLIEATTGSGHTGLKLYAVRVGTIYDAIGLLNGDVLIGIDDAPTPTLDRFTAAAAALAPSPPSVTLHVDRSGTPTEIRIEARPEGRDK